MEPLTLQRPVSISGAAILAVVARSTAAIAMELARTDAIAVVRRISAAAVAPAASFASQREIRGDSSHRCNSYSFLASNAAIGSSLGAYRVCQYQFDIFISSVNKIVHNVTMPRLRIRPLVCNVVLLSGNSFGCLWVFHIKIAAHGS